VIGLEPPGPGVPPILDLFLPRAAGSLSAAALVFEAEEAGGSAVEALALEDLRVELVGAGLEGAAGFDLLAGLEVDGDRERALLVEPERMRGGVRWGEKERTKG